MNWPTALKLRLPRFPIAVEFTREGVIFMLLSLAIGAAAVNTGNNILYFIFSLMLGMIVISGMASRRILQGLQPTVQFPEHVFAGVANVCYVSVLNQKKRLPSIAIRFVIRDPKFTGVVRHFFFIRAKDHVSGYSRFLFTKRGVYRLSEVELQSQFPFSFFLKIRRYSSDDVVRVYPRVFRISEDLLSRYVEGVIRESPYRGDSQQLLHLRDYTNSDSSKRIHWKASAKAEKLLVKEYQKEQGQNLYLYFDCYPDQRNDPTLEKALSFLASLAFLFREKEMNARIVFPNRVFETNSSLIDLLSYLAEWQETTSYETIQDLAPPPESLVLQLRSRKFGSRLGSVTPNARTLYVEDWQHLMREEDLIAL